ncbi:MAG TPA: glycosyltransferase [Candidatus Saccharimonadales bacterium]|nr:glycosyltransferase [Candidatus Saccharimonadales bacterium]
MKKITVVIPCYNEEGGIAAVVRSFPRAALRRQGYSLEVLVVDNNSKDRTAEVARAAGARVLHEPQQGKGNAIRAGFYNISDDTDYVVMCDGDDTYKAHEILRLVEPLDSGFCDVVIGSRLGGKIAEGSMKGFNRLGNWGFSFLVRYVYGVNVTDTLTGYFAWKREVVQQLRQHLKSSGFSIEMEMITKMARLGYQMYSVPITYEPRLGESSLRPVHDGVRILREFMRQLRWSPRTERVAFVSDAIWPYNKGGKEKRLHEITRRLVKEGRQVDIYTMKWWDGPDSVVSPSGVHLHSITRLHPLYKDGRRSIVQAVRFSAGCLRLLFRRFDVIDVDSMPFFPLFSVRVVCWLRGKKMHATWHEVWGRDYWRDYLGGFGGKLGALTEWLAMKLPNVVISNSNHTTKRLLQAGMNKQIVTVPLGVDVETLFAVPPHDLRSDVIFAGRLLPNKNVDLLVRAVALVKRTKPDVRCLVIGNGPERERLEALTERLGLENNVTFFNFLEDHNELYALMKSSKMFVLPSIREGFSLVSIEANACGLPVITTAHEQNAARELIIVGRNGYLAELDVKHLAAQMRLVLRARGLKPRQAVEEEFGTYRWHHAAAAVEQVLATHQQAAKDA